MKNSIIHGFHGGTKIVTKDGVRELKSIRASELIEVLCADGKWRSAAVVSDGFSTMQKYLFSSGRSKVEIICTENQPWKLLSSNVTKSISIGDHIDLLNKCETYDLKTKYDYQSWTTGFVIGDGSDELRGDDPDKGYTKVSLFGAKTKYKDYFSMAGYSVSQPKYLDKNYYAIKKGAIKQSFLNSKAWRFLTPEQKCHLFMGLYAADGSGDRHILDTSDVRVAQMVSEISAIAGFHISQQSEKFQNTNYKSEALLIHFGFRLYQIYKNPWILKEISSCSSSTPLKAWNVIEPVTNTFVLNGGIIAHS